MTRETLVIRQNPVTGECWCEVSGHPITRPAWREQTVAKAKEHAELMGYRLRDESKD